MNILFLYNETQTFTNTVFEHVAAFGRYSKHRVFYCHHDQIQNFNVELTNFDVVVMHYSIRLPYDQVSPSAAQALSEYKGLKALFIQDEYENTCRAWHWIKTLGFQLVFTVVPEKNIHRVYPPEEFPGVLFVNNLTGYVPEHLPATAQLLPPSQRELVIGYRGRSLPIRYGSLGLEKVQIGKITRQYCEKHNIKHDIAWAEEARIYGDGWYQFMGSCRAMLGSESGSNVFDWRGDLADQIGKFKMLHPLASEKDVYGQLIASLDEDGLMNQVSPRIFESIAMKTVLVLFEGVYSDVVKAGEHFIPLKKDGSNLDQVFELLNDANYVDEMAERAYADVIGSGEYSYKAFVERVDHELDALLESFRRAVKLVANDETDISPSPITTAPVRAKPVINQAKCVGLNALVKKILFPVWANLPEKIRVRLRPAARALVGRVR